MITKSLVDASKIRGGYGKSCIDDTYESLIIKFKNGTVIKSIGSAENVTRGKGIKIHEVKEEEFQL